MPSAIKKSFLLLAGCLMLLAAPLAPAAPRACDAVRFGYPDFEIEPYVLGAGSAVPPQPGAAIELARKVFELFQCPLQLVRLPPYRIRSDTIAGNLQGAFVLAANAELATQLALPMDDRQQIDLRRSMHVPIYVYVRRADLPMLKGAPAALFRHRVLGVTLGSFYMNRLVAMGLRVDEGAREPNLNLKKLHARRIDGFAAIGPSLDKYILAHAELDLVRLEQPIMVANVHLAFSRSYYQANRDKVEAIWKWVGANGQAQFDELFQKYTNDMP